MIEDWTISAYVKNILIDSNFTRGKVMFSANFSLMTLFYLNETSFIKQGQDDASHENSSFLN